jgi:hypothetical protein
MKNSVWARNDALDVDGLNREIQRIEFPSTSVTSVLPHYCHNVFVRRYMIQANSLSCILHALP